MKKLVVVMLFGLGVATAAWADEITFSAVNFSHSIFAAGATGLGFGNAINISVTDNTTGRSLMLVGPVQSGETGPATDFVAGPPLVADYTAGVAGSVMIASGSKVFLSGTMEDSGRLEAEWPDRAGAFLSRFHVDFVDPGILTDLGTSTKFSPEGSVSLTLGQTSFDGATLHATLGGSQITIETEAPIAEATTLLLFGTGTLVAVWTARNRMKSI